MIKAILFDCDGVLIDSYQSTIDYLQKTFRHFNLHIPPPESFLSLLGTKTPDIIRILQPQLTDEEFEKVYAFSMEQSLKISSTIKPMPHIENVLTSLKDTHKLGVVSNRGTTSLHAILDNLTLSKFFSVVLGREDVTFQKPDPEPIHKAMSMLDVISSQTVLVGDTAIDVAAAKGAGVQSIIYNNSDKTLGDYQITSLTEITSIIKLL